MDKVIQEATRQTVADALLKANGMGVGMEDSYAAFMRAGGMGLLNNWPQIQNQRVKAINTRPADIGKDDLAKMVVNPDGSEKSLRAASASLSYSTTTYDNIIRAYADVLTYCWYVYPTYTDNNVDKKQKMRDFALAHKLAQTIDVKAKAHEFAGLCQKYGKIFVTPRISVDKSHNKVNYAFLQQLPTDFCKIVGYNNGPGKYTVAFNLLYFLKPGNAWQQYGDLFEPYMRAFEQVVTKTPGSYVYNSIDTTRFKNLKINETIGNPEWMVVGREYFYWVTLPADKVFVFEADDTAPLVIPPWTGMFVSLTQIPNYEAAQMELILNPLTSVLTGELETYDPKGSTNDDPIRVSNTARLVYEALWYQMMNQMNTGGVGCYFAPAKNLKLQTVSDTVSNINVASNAYNDQILKAGLSSVIPTTSDPKVGVAQLSANMMASRAKHIYGSMERIMNWAFESLNLKTPMRLKMFGDIFSRDNDLETARKGATMGILPEALRYDALQGHSILDDMAISDIVDELGVLDKRIPLVTSYSAKQETSGLPPKGNVPTGQEKEGLSPEQKKEISDDGRPAEEGSINGETHEDNQ